MQGSSSWKRPDVCGGIETVRDLDVCACVAEFVGKDLMFAVGLRLFCRCSVSARRWGQTVGKDLMFAVGLRRFIGLRIKVIIAERVGKDLMFAVGLRLF